MKRYLAQVMVSDAFGTARQVDPCLLYTSDAADDREFV